VTICLFILCWLAESANKRSKVDNVVEKPVEKMAVRPKMTSAGAEKAVVFAVAPEADKEKAAKLKVVFFLIANEIFCLFFKSGNKGSEKIIRGKCVRITKTARFVHSRTARETEF
jgi:hypothetical protein